jgi:Rha family phage regulatory protein
MNDGFPMLFIRDGAVLANSRTVAEAFGKQHKDVLKATRELCEKLPEDARRNFAPFKTNDLTGESTSHFEMTRDGFTLLAMGFTGEKALRWKLKYIEAFNRMEAELRSGPTGGAFAEAIRDIGAALKAQSEEIRDMRRRLDDADASRAEERECARVDGRLREDPRYTAIGNESIHWAMRKHKVPRKGRGRFLPLSRKALVEYAASIGVNPIFEREHANGYAEPLFPISVIEAWLKAEGDAMIADHLAKRPFQRRRRDSQCVLPFKKPGAK